MNRIKFFIWLCYLFVNISYSSEPVYVDPSWVVSTYNPKDELIEMYSEVDSGVMDVLYEFLNGINSQYINESGGLMKVVEQYHEQSIKIELDFLGKETSLIYITDTKNGEIYYRGDQLKGGIEIKKNRAHQTFECPYPSGNVFFSRHYKYGVEESMVFYYENEHPSIEINTGEDRRMRVWSPQGYLLFDTKYRGDQIELKKKYYNSGNLHVELQGVGGVPNGKIRKFDESGVVIKEAILKDGQIIQLLFDVENK